MAILDLISQVHFVYTLKYTTIVKVLKKWGSFALLVKKFSHSKELNKEDIK